MKLYDYYRSTASYRVRIALNLKGIDAELTPVNLLKEQQKSGPYKCINPQQLVPAMETNEGVLTQSLSIIEYLNEIYPDPPLLPQNPWQRARCRSMAYVIACDIHPLNNLRVINHLRNSLQQDDESVLQWIRNWIEKGFFALEQMAEGNGFLGGETPMLPEIMLVPQMYNARRFEVPLNAFPKLVRISKRCEEIQTFANAAPDVVLN